MDMSEEKKIVSGKGSHFQAVVEMRNFRFLKNIAFIVAFAIIFSGFNAAFAVKRVEEEEPVNPYGTPEVKITSNSSDFGPIEQKSVTFLSGDRFVAVKGAFNSSSANRMRVTLDIPGEDGKVAYVKDGTLYSMPLSGELPDAMVFIDTTQAHVVLGPAVLYQPYGDGNLRDTGSGSSIIVKQTDGGYRICMDFDIISGMEAQVWWLISHNNLVSWDDSALALWTRLDLNGIHRICYDGAYYETPSTYTPYAEGMFYRNPAVYPAGVLIEESGDLAAELSFVLLDAAVRLQNDEGYWESCYQSNWLYEDYGILAGFYDTRFNNDVTVTLFAASELFDDARFFEAAVRQCDWLLKFAGEHHYTVNHLEILPPETDEFGNIMQQTVEITGILVQDYFSPFGENLVHCALNHQLQEIKALLLASEYTGEEKYMDMARLMLNGISITKDMWINPEVGLEYAYLADGSMGLTDYPYLTYNDLLDVQELLERRGERSAALDEMIAAKLTHMLENGITGYQQ